MPKSLEVEVSLPTVGMQLTWVPHESVQEFAGLLSPEAAAGLSELLHHTARNTLAALSASVALPEMISENTDLLDCLTGAFIEHLKTRLERAAVVNEITTGILDQLGEQQQRNTRN